MNKQIIVSLLLLTSTITHGMMQTLADTENNNNEIREHFIAIARDRNRQFTQNDLQQSGYLSITTSTWDIHQKNLTQQPLVQIALDTADTKKVKQIIEHAQKLNFCYHNNQNPLLTIALLRLGTKGDNGKIHYDLLKIARRFLNHGCLVDYRANDNIYTPLIGSVLYKDEALTKLLLEHRANPYIETFNPHTQEMVTVFNFEPEKGWLQRIIDEVRTGKDNQ